MAEVKVVDCKKCGQTQTARVDEEGIVISSCVVCGYKEGLYTYFQPYIKGSLNKEKPIRIRAKSARVKKA